MAESLEANGVLDGHALDFDIVDPNAADEILDESEYLEMPEDQQEEEGEEGTVIVESIEELVKPYDFPEDHQTPVKDVEDPQNAVNDNVSDPYIFAEQPVSIGSPREESF